MKYNLSIPHLSDDKRELKYIAEAMENNNIGSVGKFIAEFEYAVRKLTGAKYALAVTSGTSALHLALIALGIGKGDDVLASTFTYIGSAAPITYVGANPVFIDSEAGTWNLDPNLLEDFLKARRKCPKALILTHIYGQPANMDDIMMVCGRFGVTLIEDAAEAIGATYDERHCGTFGTAGIFSFAGNKLLTSGGGGILVTDDKRLIETASYYASNAREPMMHHEHNNIGYNYRMSNLLAAVGLAQMEFANERIYARRRIFKTYENAFAGDGRIKLMPQHIKASGNRWLTAALFDGVDPKKLMVKLANQGIETRPLWKPMHTQPVFSYAEKYVSGVSERLFGMGLCLPSCSQMTDAQVRAVAAEITGMLDITG
ncbi:DegT/DnrJ/EryC1/StrS aminotransferase family protein [Seleniivibrio woodruffii]|uniref:DegT/DnrJ/EryC1/StrS family aminotransferase n=1 Tax=Seleniivibrio woodruffii TaxID=1078050 RepID=UPI0026F19179|nr:DegT/DnrJ/EryC1/StrS family aminotransferase [Seleniivibrio woodruffii]